MYFKYNFQNIIFKKLFSKKILVYIKIAIELMCDSKLIIGIASFLKTKPNIT